MSRSEEFGKVEIIAMKYLRSNSSWRSKSDFMSKLLRFNDAHYIHFVTSRTWQSVPHFNNERNCLLLLKAIKELRKKVHFRFIGYVIMPDHFHFLIEPDIKGEYSISYIMMCIKGYSARMINLTEAGLAEAEPSAKRVVDNMRLTEPSAKCEVDNKRLGEGLASPYQSNVWQKSFYDIQIYSDKFLQQKLDYIHNNPIRAGLVKNLDDYPWSSYQNYYLNNHSLIKID